MTKVGRPKRLIGYDTDSNIERRKAKSAPKLRLLRARTGLYAALLTFVGGFMLHTLTTRATLEIAALHDRTPPYVVLSDGSIRNAFTLKIVNKANEARTLTLKIEGARAVAVTGVGEAFENGVATIEAPADGVRSARIFVTHKPAAESNAFALKISLSDQKTGQSAVETTTFLMGAKP